MALLGGESEAFAEAVSALRAAPPTAGPDTLLALVVVEGWPGEQTLDDLNEAIESLFAFVQSGVDAMWPMLGTALAYRFDRLGREDDLHLALCQLAEAAPGTPQAFTRARLRHERAMRDNDSEQLGEAIAELAECADHPELGATAFVHVELGTATGILNIMMVQTRLTQLSENAFLCGPPWGFMKR